MRFYSLGGSSPLLRTSNLNQLVMKKATNSNSVVVTSWWRSGVKWLVLVGLATGLVLNPLIEAQDDATTDKYNQQLTDILRDIDSAKVDLEGLATKRHTLEGAIAHLDEQISDLQANINQTETDIVDLDRQIDDLNQQIEDQKQLLGKLLVVLYHQSNASSFEILLNSDNFGDYIDSQQYLGQLQDGIVTSVNKIKQSQMTLEERQYQKQRSLAALEGQKIATSALRWEKQSIVEETKGQEALFQRRLSQLERDYQTIQRQLEAYLAGLARSKTSLGPIKAGDTIGKVGNTGWSTGPHLHLAIYEGKWSNHKDPARFLKNNRLVWPVGGNGGWVSQGFHAGHKALDVAAREGTPVRAIAGGEMIHRGCMGVGTFWATFGVVIDHGDYNSLYIHLQAPDNPKYNQCNINLRSQKGKKSIDYSTKE